MIILIASAVFTGVKNENAKPSVRINNMEQAKQYLDSHTFDDISMMQFYRQVFVYNNSSINDQKMKIEDFKIGLYDDYRVRAMTMNVIDTSELKSYLILYDRDTDYFNVIERQGKQNFNKSATEVLTKFDKYKNGIMFPKEDYSYYTVDMFSTESIGAAKNLYVINDLGVHRVQDGAAEGVAFMVYGEPITKKGSPNFYIMPN